MEAPDLRERLRAFVAERTGLSSDQIAAVIQACEDFWWQYPDAMIAARALYDQLEERED